MQTRSLNKMKDEQHMFSKGASFYLPASIKGRNLERFLPRSTCKKRNWLQMEHISRYADEVPASPQTQISSWRATRIRADTTLDHSQKAEKEWTIGSCLARLPCMFASCCQLCFSNTICKRRETGQDISYSAKTRLGPSLLRQFNDCSTLWRASCWISV